MNIMLIPLGISLLGVAVAGWLNRHVQSHADGNDQMRSIALAIKEGANAFLRRQYRSISIISASLAVLIFTIYAATGNVAFGVQTAIAFIIGALCSGVAGYTGMFVSVRANLKTAAAADRKDLNGAVRLALRAGAIEGVLVVALCLFGISALFLVYNQLLGFETRAIPSVLVGFGFGASIVALFAQLGGGIYTKAADVGADLVGKVEAGIPEDDPRNPAVIADLVGDNVGDCAGRGADLFESIAAENIGAMILGVALFAAFGVDGIAFPLIILSAGLIASIIGVLSVRVRHANEDPLTALNRGYYVTSVLVTVALFFGTRMLLGEQWLWFFAAGLVGIVLNLVFIHLTKYYTDHKYRPVQEIARASETGPATNIISGLAVGLENVGLPVIAIAAALVGAFALGEASGIAHGGIYGTAVATIGMLASAAYILTMDTFGPITDNAGGIVEMSSTAPETRAITDRLDAVGNTTKA
ncbi:MAG: sodium/proton-translocating pyrophosphatase, partial [Candidatus Kerfeldbacteria bacterium]|nr:sodium/proton-translocating pyrophosphatase [Candidatus Kerfeldbacteria bacterium]